MENDESERKRPICQGLLPRRGRSSNLTARPMEHALDHWETRGGWTRRHPRTAMAPTIGTTKERRENDRRESRHRESLGGRIPSQAYQAILIKKSFIKSDQAKYA